MTSKADYDSYSGPLLEKQLASSKQWRQIVLRSNLSKYPKGFIRKNSPRTHLWPIYRTHMGDAWWEIITGK